MRHRSALVALTFATATLLSGCGGSDKVVTGTSGTPSTGSSATSTPSGSASTDPKPSDSLAPKILTKAQIKEALLTPPEIGSAFKVDTSDDSDDDSSLGCLDKFGDIELVNDTVREGSVDIAPKTDFGLPAVYSGVATFKTTEDAERAMAALRKTVATCTSVRETDKDGTKYRLGVSHTDDADPLADDQFNINAGGTLLTSGVNVTVGFDLAMARVGNNLIAIGFGTAGTSASPDKLAAVMGLALPRLRAVMAGKPVPKSESLGFKALTAKEGFAGSTDASA